MIVKFHHLLQKSKNVVIVLLLLTFTGSFIYVSYKSDKNRFYNTIKTDVITLNTALLNNTYIENVETEEEPKKEENSSNKEIVVNKPNENKKIESNTQIIEPASTTVENEQPPVQPQTLDGVYVGLKFTGSITAYGKDCCGSDPSRWGITASGYDLKQSLTYNDSTYGNVRIVASDKNFKLYSIIQINDPIDGSYKAIVLDRAGSVIGLNKTKKFDLAVESEAYAASSYGVHKNVSFEVLRVGR